MGLGRNGEWERGGSEVGQRGEQRRRGKMRVMVEILGWEAYQEKVERIL